MGKISPDTDGVVMFRNSQGVEGRGTMLHLTRDVVVFEVYNPYSVVQLSEVLRDVRIFRGERAIYDGRAVATNLVPTGLMVVASATLLDSWSDLVGLAPGEGLQQEAERFIKEWEASHALRPRYRVAVSVLRGFLGEMNRWLEQVDLSADADGLGRSSGLRRELFEEVEASIAPEMARLFAVFEHEASQIPKEEVAQHKAFARRELHPLTLCSPFVHRTYTKPLGYAGDYVMVNMMLEDPVKGANTYARIVNSFHIGAAPAAAHRNRISILGERLKAEAEKATYEGRTLRALSVGCGPAVEVQRFVKTADISQRCEFHLLDFNDETIESASRHLRQAMDETGREVRVKFVHKSVNELLRQAVGRIRSPQDSFDMVYAGGLLDYFPDRVCSRLLRLFYEWTSPGGLVLVTNAHPGNPVRHCMEHLLEWHLNHRSEADMLALAAGLHATRVYTDATGVNVFLEIRRAGS